MKKTVKLHEISKFYSGGTPSRTNKNYWNGKIPWVKTAQVQNKVIEEIDIEEYISEEGLKHSSAKIVPKGTIIMAMYGQGKTRGQVGILGLDASINQACAAIKLKDGVNRVFVYQQLLYKYDLIRRMSNSGSQENLSLELIKRIEIFLPPLPEQKAIADILSTWDEAIEKTEKLIKEKEKRFKQMSKWFLFGHKRVSLKCSGLKKGAFFSFSKDWELLKIGKVAKEVSVRNNNSNAIVLSCSKYDGLVNSLDYFGKKVFSDDTSNYKVVKKWQFAYPSNHVEEGSIGLLEHCDEGIVSPIYVVFETNQEQVYPPFLYKLLKTEIFRHIFQVSTSSSVDRRGSLRWNEFSTIKIPVPSIEEQKQIAETLNSAQDEINLLKKLSEKYKQQKQGLMQKLLTGEWRVRNV